MQKADDLIPIDKYVSKQLEEKLDLLLQEKHLYQGVRLIDVDDTWAKQAHLHHAMDCATPRLGGGGTTAVNVPLETFQAQYSRYVKGTFWSISLNRGSGAGMPVVEPKPFICPNVFDSYCAHCKLDQRIFFPDQAIRTSNSYSGDEARQSWVLVFSCAKCQSKIEFFIAQNGNELKMCGRFPVEFRAQPREVPESIHSYLSKATIAADTGYVLAGILYLRVAIEQYFRAHPGVKSLCNEPKVTGDALGEAYNKCIPKKLKEVAPSLKDIYSKLSEAIHAARDDRPLFDMSLQDVIKHFKARELLEIKDDPNTP